MRFSYSKKPLNSDGDSDVDGATEAESEEEDSYEEIDDDGYR